MLNPMRYRYEGMLIPGWRMEDICEHGLSRMSAGEGNASHELGWKIKVMF